MVIMLSGMVMGVFDAMIHSDWRSMEGDAVTSDYGRYG